jgi:hypothetical protein
MSESVIPGFRIDNIHITIGINNDDWERRVNRKDRLFKNNFLYQDSNDVVVGQDVGHGID